MKAHQLSRLMRMSWEIQKRRKTSRSKSLLNAWAIFLNEDVTVLHLAEKLSGSRQVKHSAMASLSLFAR